MDDLVDVVIGWQSARDSACVPIPFIVAVELIPLLSSMVTLSSSPGLALVAGDQTLAATRDNTCSCSSSTEGTLPPSTPVELHRHGAIERQANIFHHLPVAQFHHQYFLHICRRFARVRRKGRATA